MDTPNAFIGKTTPPTAKEVTAALGPSAALWNQLVDWFAEQEVTIQEWNSYSPKAGWSLRMKRKARTIVWLGPREGCFIAAFVLGDKAMQAARAGKLPQRIVKIMNEAPKYPEGTGIRITLQAPKDLAAVKTLAADVARQADALAQAKNLDAARDAFKPLSKSLIKYLKDKNVPAGTYHEVYCPMADASWLQTGREIRNPYYGSQMLDCGQLKN